MMQGIDPAAIRAAQTPEELYALIPEGFTCKRKCQAACGFIPYADAEEAAMLKAGISLPLTTEASAPSCSKLLPGLGTCSIYSKRPLVCRLFGVVEAMPCPFECEPVLHAASGEALLGRMMELS